MLPSVWKKTSKGDFVVSDTGKESFQDAAVCVVTNEQMQEGNWQRRIINKGIKGLDPPPKTLQILNNQTREQPPSSSFFLASVGHIFPSAQRGESAK